jgi:hypothetical protein
MASTTIVVDRIGQASDPADDLADRNVGRRPSARKPRQPLDGRSIVCPILDQGEFPQMACREGLPVPVAAIILTSRSSANATTAKHRFRWRNR